MSSHCNDYPRRRTVVVAAGSVLTGALAGCSGDGGGGTTNPEDGGTRPETTASDGTTEPAETETGGQETTSTPTRTATPEDSRHELVDRVVQEGYFSANNAGSRSPPFEHLYRSEATPLELETDVGGTVAARPHEDGVELATDLTAEDEFAGCSVYFGRFDLATLSEIDPEIDGDGARIVIQLDLSQDGDFLQWATTGDDREQFAGFGGDDRAISEYVSGGPIRADEPIFSIPPGGAKEPTRGLSIEDLREYDADTVWIGNGIDHTAVELPGTNRVVITDFGVG